MYRQQSRELKGFCWMDFMLAVEIFFTIVSLPAHARLSTLAASNEVVHAGEAA
jgi:hypothetical protein